MPGRRDVFVDTRLPSCHCTFSGYTGIALPLSRQEFRLHITAGKYKWIIFCRAFARIRRDIMRCDAARVSSAFVLLIRRRFTAKRLIFQMPFSSPRYFFGVRKYVFFILHGERAGCRFSSLYLCYGLLSLPIHFHDPPMRTFHRLHNHAN